MEFARITEEFFPALTKIQMAYKREIGEDEPSEQELSRLCQAIREDRIFFYGCLAEGALVAVCSVCKTFSTFNYQPGGVFEDFYIKPAYRHKGIARKLAAYAYQQSGVSSLSVGCADCDVKLYQAIGFRIPLGNLLTYDAALYDKEPRNP